jgi:hypothetical protein
MKCKSEGYGHNSQWNCDGKEKDRERRRHDQCLSIGELEECC